MELLCSWRRATTSMSHSMPTPRSTLLLLLLLLLSISFTLALDKKAEKQQENSITGDEVVQVTPPQHQADEIDTHSCYPDMCVIIAELSAMQTRLAAAETHMQELKRENTIQALEIQALKRRSNFTEAELREHSRLLEELSRGNVAFSASVGGRGHTGPYDVETTLKYKNVLANIGNAYNPATGIFVAPIRGIYYFNFCYHASQQNGAAIALYKNSELVASASSHDTDTNSPVNGSNGVALQLEEMDQVHLRSNSWVWDGPYHDTVFTGFLVNNF
ncbi:uncharacterized protein LOC121690232 [Alosa sapidissima]|uniref:uncharacterized protein LOC121690232 n=1 Tax=Alosa sapidissima TaxID=34773 RepID=UPI001C0A0EBF|nr:uncharacterized protein LOC121690232 [Alosa sapidissima]